MAIYLMHLISVGGDNVSVDYANEDESQLNKYICLFCCQFLINFSIETAKAFIVHKTSTVVNRKHVQRVWR